MRVLMILLLLACVAQADPPAPAPPSAQDAAAKAQAAVSSRALSRWKALLAAWGECPTCKGKGMITRPRQAPVPCTDCKGKTVALLPDRFRKAFLEYASPAVRALPAAALDEVVAEASAPIEKRGLPKVGEPARRVAEVDVLDATHALVWIARGADLSAKAEAWLQATPKGAKEPQWFRHSAEGDGEWPWPMPTERVIPSTGSGIPEEQFSALREALAAARAPYALDAAAERDGALLLSLRMGPTFPDGTELAPLELAALKAVLASETWKSAGSWAELETTFLGKQRGPEGQEELRPVAVVTLSREASKRKDWEAAMGGIGGRPIEGFRRQGAMAKGWTLKPKQS